MCLLFAAQRQEEMENGSNVELMLLTNNLSIHLSKTQGFATPALKIGPESLVVSDVSL